MNLLTLVCLAACIVVKLEMKRSSRLTEGSSFRTKSAAASLGDLDGRIRKERRWGDSFEEGGASCDKTGNGQIGVTHSRNK